MNTELKIFILPRFLFIGESQVAVEQTVELMPNVTLKYQVSSLNFVPNNASLGRNAHRWAENKEYG